MNEKKVYFRNLPDSVRSAVLELQAAVEESARIEAAHYRAQESVSDARHKLAQELAAAGVQTVGD